MSKSQKVLIGAAGAAGVGVAAWKTLFPYITDDYRTLRQTWRVSNAIWKDLLADNRVIDMFEADVEKHPTKPFIIFEDKIYTYEYVDMMANKIANVALSWNLDQLDTVAMMIYNEPAFVWTFLGLQKIGLAAAFVNYHLKSTPLAHTIKVSEAKVLIVGEGDDLLESVQEIKKEIPNTTIHVIGKSKTDLPDGFSSLSDHMIRTMAVPICKSVRETVPVTHPCCFIYTSGTTGLPKPAVINQWKASAMTNNMQIINFNENDIAYAVTPLYHSAATTLSLFNVIGQGATLVLGRKFSARHYWEEVRKHKVTVIQYIGELCRYLLRVPKSDLDVVHNVRVALGNGLRPDIWDEFRTRFNIPHIAEFFGATEGTAGTWNIFNRAGCVGRWSPLTRALGPGGVPLYLVRYDPVTYEPMKDKNGRCIVIKPGEEGLMISAIPEQLFTFYKGPEQMNEKKIIRNAFSDGDAFFNFGDLFYLDGQYYLYFRDRVGDTFRWKGENVSTSEVANVLSTLPFIHDANVFGVQIPGEDGRAGMAALTLHQDQQVTPEILKGIYGKCEHELPTYARPVFIRFMKEFIVTQTMKNRKIELIEEGFDFDKVTDPLFVIDNKSKTYKAFNIDNSYEVLQSKL
ncbi:Very long-chain acyl-CoA synthetase,Bile acyl-CoA synthetase [Mytilus edulis]|uniref:long-chain-fatty-acid--CoA ligase n=1 Tax=Mytilus edulis TaxID=6550 RepID=A0A8S3TID8_MYTED|nr:Very long-chain acyl-CoA synthetase,Bile acyl-CoA synthetase [Mytilus edulis]